MCHLLNRLQLNKMGGASSKQQFPQTRHYTILDYGYCKVWKRSDTQKQTMEQYEIVIDSQKMLQSYKRMWLLRAQEEAVVGVYYFTHKANKQICGFYQNGSILTQRIPYRLSQFSNIPYEEILYILKISLKSFEMLHAEYGLFLVRSTMIGINMQKQIKVWSHTDFSAAQPENANCKNMTEMIESIIESVEINAELPCYYPKFSDFMKINKNKIAPTFEDVSKALATYIKMNKIPKSQSIPKLSNYLRQAQGWQELTYNSNFLTNLSNISQLNKSSFGKYSFKGNSENSSVSSSRKTLKNSPGYNIYTQKQVIQRSKERERERNHLRSAKSQKMDAQPQSERYQYVLKPLQWGNHHQRADEGSILRGHSIQNSNFNKIQIKIPNKRNANSPSPQLKQNTVSSIDRRIHETPQQFNNVYYGAVQNQYDFQATQPIRTNRFHQNRQCLAQLRSQSRSPTSSTLYYKKN